jgi:glutamate synthase (NADPH/NADH) small chain
MDYLTQQNRRLKGQEFSPEETITAEGRHVVIIGGGDTGADCLGTAHRHGAAGIVQMEILPRPPERRRPGNPWPQWPTTFRTSSAHEEGGDRDYNVLTKRFIDDGNGNVRELVCARIEWKQPENGGRPEMVEVPGSEFTLKADLVLLAMGFLHPEHAVLDDFGVEKDERGNCRSVDGYRTSREGVFVAGDMRRGQSLVVWAITEGRECARAVDTFLTGRPSQLSAKDRSKSDVALV